MRVFKSARLSAVLAASMLLCSCGTATTVAPNSASSEIDRSYFFETVETLRDRLELSVLEPDSVKEALPNQQYVGDSGTIRFSFTDLWVVGEISSVAKGDGIVHGSSEDLSTLVPFDEESADERNLVVTVEPERMIGAGHSVADPLSFRMGVLLGSDPAPFIAAVRDLGRVVIGLKQIRSGRYVGEYTPILNGASIGLVAADGTISFPGLGAQEKAFKGDVPDVAALIEAGRAHRPDHALATLD